MMEAGRSRWITGVLVTPLLAWLGLPGTFSWWPLLLICLMPLLRVLTRARSWRKAFGIGLLTGVIWHALQVYWIVPVLMHFGGLDWYLAVPALLLLLLYMALYTGSFSVGFYLLQRHGNALSCCFGAAALWVGLDWLRSWLFSGFPWMDIGYGLWQVPRLVQAADLFGHFGYTFILVAINVVFMLLVIPYMRLRRTALAAVAAVILMTACYAAVRWGEVEAQIANSRSAVIGLVQGNVGQERKWSPEIRRQTVLDYVRLSDELRSKHNPAVIVWPETALPFYPQNSDLFQIVRGFISTRNQPLITGAPWYEIREEGLNRLISCYNAALLLLPDGTADVYCKTHLVPFGEYVPLQRYLTFIGPLVESVGAFSPGHVERPLSPGSGIDAGVLICFESIFGNLGRQWVNAGANVLVNITNDAWYGRSSAPHQSWAMTVMRAVETRRSLVRAANTGISGIVDPLGRTICRSELFVPWSAAGSVSLMGQRSFFVRLGYLFAPLCGMSGLLILIGIVKRPLRRDRFIV